MKKTASGIKKSSQKLQDLPMFLFLNTYAKMVVLGTNMLAPKVLASSIFLNTRTKRDVLGTKRVVRGLPHTANSSVSSTRTKTDVLGTKHVGLKLKKERTHPNMRLNQTSCIRNSKKDSTTF